MQFGIFSLFCCLFHFFAGCLEDKGRWPLVVFATEGDISVRTPAALVAEMGTLTSASRNNGVAAEVGGGIDDDEGCVGG